MRFLSLVALALGAASVPAAEPDLVFPDGANGARLRLEVTVEEKTPEGAWTAFLDKLFARFDRDGDGALSAEEANRVFSLPLPDGREVLMDFAMLDTNRDGKGSPEEFRRFYLTRGFAPVTAVARPAPAETLALGDALFRHLDRDRDGKLSAAELRAAPGLLKRLDEDEDEVLTAAELLGSMAHPTKTNPAGLKLGTSDNERGARGPTLKLALDRTPTLVGDRGPFRLSADGTRLDVVGGVCSVSVSKDDPAVGFRKAKNFYLAQFKAATGDKPATKAVFEADPTAQVLVGLFDAADRDGDGKLTRPELEAFFDLNELGIGCRVLVTVTDRGRNVFDLFDRNGDGRLDLDELTRAGQNLSNELTRDKPLERSDVPASYQLTVSRGPVGDSFGLVPFGGTTKPKSPGPPAVRGPAWFRAMDKNGDGFVSAREFVGPPERFVQLDANGDGRISVEEAKAAKP